MSNDGSHPVHSFAVTWIESAIAVTAQITGFRDGAQRFLDSLRGHGLIAYIYRRTVRRNGRDAHEYLCLVSRENGAEEALQLLKDAAVKNSFDVIDRTAPSEPETRKPSETA